MFALRRPNVLPVGDLGVQRGMVLFNLAGPEGPKIASKKRKTDPDGEAADEANGTEEAEIDNPFQAGSSELVPGSETDADVKLEHDVKTEASLPLAMAERRHGDVGPSLAVATGPPAPADSLAEGESSEVKLESVPPIPAEAGLTFKDLRARADGKKIKGNLYLRLVAFVVSSLPLGAEFPQLHLQAADDISPPSLPSGMYSPVGLGRLFFLVPAFSVAHHNHQPG